MASEEPGEIRSSGSSFPQWMKTKASDGITGWDTIFVHLYFWNNNNNVFIKIHDDFVKNYSESLCTMFFDKFKLACDMFVLIQGYEVNRLISFFWLV